MQISSKQLTRDNGPCAGSYAAAEGRWLIPLPLELLPIYERLKSRKESCLPTYNLTRFTVKDKKLLELSNFNGIYIPDSLHLLLKPRCGTAAFQVTCSRSKPAKQLTGHCPQKLHCYTPVCYSYHS